MVDLTGITGWPGLNPQLRIIVHSCIAQQYKLTIKVKYGNYADLVSSNSK